MNGVRHNRTGVGGRWSALLLLALSCANSHAQSKGKVLVVATSAAGPYREALEGLRAGLNQRGRTMAVIDLASAAPAGSPSEWVQAQRPDLIVAVGSKAVRLATSANSQTPVISTMVLSEAAQEGSVAVLGLEPAPERWLEKLSALLPRMRRLGLLAGRATPAAKLDAVETRARQMGYTVWRAQVADAPAALIALAEMAGSVDLVWCAPDTALFNDATVKPLLLAALQRQLPVIGFSEAFVRSGAAIGFFPDFGDIGSRTAELAQKVLSGGAVASYEAPRVVKVAVNERVVRILGLRSHMAEAKAAEALVIR